MQTDIRERLQHALGDAYAIERELAPGGMSRLFVALELSLGRRVVVKVLPPELASEVSVARFQREIALTANLQHPHILTILSAGAGAGLLYYIAPYVEGESLRHRLSRDGALPVTDGIRVLREIADALAYAHARGVIHRDVKPENILLLGEHALLADFGVARAMDSATGAQRLTGTGTGIGTPTYMAPEQVLAGDLEPDARSDIYALGIVAYETLAGSPPFAGADLSGMVARFTTPAPTLTGARAEVPRAVSDAISRAIELSPEQRLPTAAAFRDAMDDRVVRRGMTRVDLRGGRGRLTLAATLAAILILLAVQVWRKAARVRVEETGARAEQRVEASAIAVLPFINLTPSSDNQYFSDGMTEELITALSRVNGLHVVGRSSAFAFKGSQKNLSDISKTLHVASVVEGSVRRSQSQLRVSARLVDARSGYEMWSENYDRSPRDVFAIQDQIARAIASAVGKKLDSTFSGGDSVSRESAPIRLQSSVLVKRSTSNMEAYDLYLRARQMREQRGEGGLRGAIALLTQAIAKDSNYADAYASLALTYFFLPDYSAISDDSVTELVSSNATRALKLDPRSAEAELALAGLAGSHWRWSDERAHIRRAIMLDPSAAPAHEQYAILLRTTGAFGASIAEHRAAMALDPLSPPIGWNLAITQWNARQYRDAVESSTRAIQLAPNLPNAYMALAIALTSAGEPDSAAKVIEQLRVRFPNNAFLALLGAWVYGKDGRSRDAEALLDETRRLRIGTDVTAEAVAMAYLGIGNTDSALTWIETSVRNHESDWEGDMSPCGALFDALRTQKRFRAATVALGLPQCSGLSGEIDSLNH